MTNPQHSAIKVEHYTPRPIILLVRELLGEIELDPASDPSANEVVRAKQIFTQEDDGFNQYWSAATVFCNPPGRNRSERYNPGVADWFNKMHSEYVKGNFSEGIFLGYTLEVLSKCGYEALQFPICIPQPRRLGVTTGMGRIKFDAISTSGVRESQVSPTHGNVLIYFPPQNVSERKHYERIESFHRIFNALGACK